MFRKDSTANSAQNEPDRYPALGIRNRCAMNVGLGLISATAALCLAALGAILFLGADKAQSPAMLANNARPFNALLEPPK